MNIYYKYSVRTELLLYKKIRVGLLMFISINMD